VESTTRRLDAPATTWLLVTTWPRSSITKPEPLPLPRSPRTDTVTTPGSTRSATALSPEAVVAGAPAAEAAAGRGATAASSSSVEAPKPATPPSTVDSATVATSPATAPRRPRRAGSPGRAGAVQAACCGGEVGYVTPAVPYHGVVVVGWTAGCGAVGGAAKPGGAGGPKPVGGGGGAGGGVNRRPRGSPSPAGPELGTGTGTGGWLMVGRCLSGLCWPRGTVPSR